MQIGAKTIETKEELLNLIKEGINPLEYVKNENDIEFISNSIIIEGNDEDSYFEEIAETTFKAILYYVLFTDNEEKTLNRCKEIAKIGLEDIDEVKNIIEKDERAMLLFKPVEIASSSTAKQVVEKLDERLSKI